MKLTNKELLFRGIRIFSGLVFILSAVFKMLSVDSFELYVFSLQWFSFNVVAVASRLIISTELLLGLLLVTGIHFRAVLRISFLLLLVFSGFLIFQIFSGEKGNCFCFGEMIQMSPLESLGKNIVLLLLLFVIRKEKEYAIKYRANLFLFYIVFCLALPPVLSPPDFFLNWTQPDEHTLNIISNRINENESLDTLQIQSGKKIICLFSITCEYCILAANKISIIADKYQLQENTVIIFTGDENLLGNFWEESKTIRFDFQFLPSKQFFSIAGPTVPSIYLSENGKVIQRYNYRSINEKEIKEFFSE